MPPEGQLHELGASSALGERPCGPKTSDFPKGSTTAEPRGYGVRSWRSWPASA